VPIREVHGSVANLLAIFRLMLVAHNRPSWRPARASLEARTGRCRQSTLAATIAC
jgi:hypothetical protein